ncbi:MAG: DUF4139 domain-containing protein [Candidatus Eisenbacteria bacterium]|nr:DUF4139 domain-containing protein [Candidatus Eisenbacteria bacterium]
MPETHRSVMPAANPSVRAASEVATAAVRARSVAAPFALAAALVSAAIGPAPAHALATVLASPAPAPAAAHALAAGPSVTIYSHDLALMRETRSVPVTGARDTVRLGDLPEGLDFASLRVTPASGRVTSLAYRPGAWTGDELLSRVARGTRVRVTSRGDRAEEGVLVGADGSWIVLRTEDGALHTLAREAVEDVRMAALPAVLPSRPGLDAVIEGAGRSPLALEIGYLTTGFEWSAEHTLLVRGERAGVWSTTVTVTDNTGRDFEDAELKLVAGEPHREAGGQRPMMMMMSPHAMGAMAAADAPDLSEQAFAEYHLYTLDHRVTLRNHEAQGFTMIPPRDVLLLPRYVFRGSDPRAVMTQLELVNDRASGPGVPLPAGRVRVYQADASGALKFTGEARIGATAAGEKFTLDVGAAFDLAAERKTMSERRITDREREVSIEIRLRNRKDRDVTIVVEEPAGGDVEVTARTHEPTRTDANTIQFTVPVPAGKEVKLAYTARVRY